MSTEGTTIRKPSGQFEMPARWWLSPPWVEVDGPFAIDVSVQLKWGKCEEGTRWPLSVSEARRQEGGGGQSIVCRFEEEEQGF